MHIQQSFWQRFIENQTTAEENSQNLGHLAICQQCQWTLRGYVQVREFEAGMEELVKQNQQLQATVERVRGVRGRTEL